MADELQRPVTTGPAAEPPVTAALIVYALYALTAAISLFSAGLHAAPLWSVVGVIGLIIASVVNIFLQSGVMQLIISAVGVLLFAGLTAYDTQRLKMTY